MLLYCARMLGAIPLSSCMMHDEQEVVWSVVRLLKTPTPRVDVCGCVSVIRKTLF